VNVFKFKYEGEHTRLRIIVEGGCKAQWIIHGVLYVSEEFLQSIGHQKKLHLSCRSRRVHPSHTCSLPYRIAGQKGLYIRPGMYTALKVVKCQLSKCHILGSSLLWFSGIESAQMWYPVDLYLQQIGHICPKVAIPLAPEGVLGL